MFHCISESYLSTYLALQPPIRIRNHPTNTKQDDFVINVCPHSACLYFTPYFHQTEMEEPRELRSSLL
jgi:hypothetical protein